MTGLIRRITLATILATAGLAPPAGPVALGQADRAVVPGAGFLDPDALVYLEIPRPVTLIDRLTSDRVRGLLDAIPASAEALDSPQLRQLRQGSEFVAAMLETTVDDALRRLTGGGIVLGIEEADPPRLVLVVTPSDPEFLDRAHATLVSLARADARSKANPDPIAEFSYRGLTGYSLSDQEAHAIVDGHLVLSSSRSGLEAAIDRHLDGGPRLIDAESYRARRPDSEPMAWADARVDRLRELDPDRFGAGDEPDAGAMLLLGAWIDLIRRTPFARATLDWDDDRLAATLSLDAPADGRSDVMARFLPPDGAGAPAPLKVEGLLATINLWRDQEALWQVREELLPPEALQGLAQLDSLAGTFFGGREFGDSVLAPLGTHWRLVAATQDDEAMDPTPSLKLPAFALVVDLDPDRPEFARRLRVAFQSILGLVNLGAAQTGAPPLMLGSETHDGVPISLSTFMAEAVADPDSDPGDEAAEVHYRHNFSPSFAEVNGHAILASSVGLARSLIDALRADPDPGSTEGTLLITADGPALAALVDRNREFLVLQNMIERGNDRDTAERDVSVLGALLRSLGQGTLRLIDEPGRSTLTVEFRLGAAD